MKKQNGIQRTEQLHPIQAQQYLSFHNCKSTASSYSGLWDGISASWYVQSLFWSHISTHKWKINASRTSRTVIKCTTITSGHLQIKRKAQLWVTKPPTSWMRTTKYRTSDSNMFKTPCFQTIFTIENISLRCQRRDAWSNHSHLWFFNFLEKFESSSNLMLLVLLKVEKITSGVTLQLNLTEKLEL